MTNRNFKSFYTNDSKRQSAQNMASLREYANQFEMVDDNLLLSIIHDTLYYGHHSLESAIESGNIEVLQYIIEVVLSEEGMSGENRIKRINILHRAIQVASEAGDLEIVEYLVHVLGRNLNIAHNTHLKTAVYKAARNGHLDVLIYLRELGIRFEVDDVLNQAAGKGRIQVVEYLIGQGASHFNIMNNALWAAMQSNSFEMGIYLLEFAKLTIPELHFQRAQSSALNYAVSMGLWEFYQYFKRNGGDLRQEEDNLLRQAVLNHRWEIAYDLLSVGLDPDMVTPFDESALNIAKQELTDAQDDNNMDEIRHILDFIREARRMHM